MSPQLLKGIVAGGLVVVLVGVFFLLKGGDSEQEIGSFSVTTSESGEPNLSGSGAVGITVETNNIYTLQVYLNDTLVGIYSAPGKASDLVDITNRLKEQNEIRVEYTTLPTEVSIDASGPKTFSVSLVVPDESGAVGPAIKTVTGPLSVPELGSSDTLTMAFTYDTGAAEETIEPEAVVTGTEADEALRVYRSLYSLYENKDLEGLTEALQERNRRLAGEYRMTYEDTVAFENSFVSKAFEKSDWALLPEPSDIVVKKRGESYVVSSDSQSVIQSKQLENGGGFIQISHGTVTVETIDGQMKVVAAD